MAASVFRWTCTISIATLLVSCNPWSVLSQQEETPKSELTTRNASFSAIASLPETNSGSEVYIQGKVLQKAPFVDGGAYKIQDSTGEIWVLTNNLLPETGIDILIKGQLEFHDLRLGSSDFGEFFITEAQTSPAEINATDNQNQTNIKPQKLNLDSYFMPHKENTKF